MSRRVVLEEIAANLSSQTPQTMRSLSPPRDAPTRIHCTRVRQEEGASFTTEANQRHIDLPQKVTRSLPSFYELCRPLLRFANHLHHSDICGPSFPTQRQPIHNASKVQCAGRTVPTEAQL